MLNVIGVDLGGTKIELGRVDETGKLIDHLRLPTDAAGGPQAIEEQIASAVKIMRSQSEIPIAAIGVGVAGQIEAGTGLVHFAPNLPGWRLVALQQNLQARLNLPVLVVNDLRAITWGEWLFGAGKSYADLICLFIGTGIGAGIISGGRLLEGATNTCGEVGHMTIDLNGPFCTCGNQGCFEALAGGWAIARQAQEAVVGRHRDETLLLALVNDQRHAINARLVIEAYHQGDHLAGVILEQARGAVLAGCVALINAFNPRRLVLGGGIMQGLPEWLDWLTVQIPLWALKAATRDLEIVPAGLIAESGVLGAAAVALKSIENSSGEVL